MIRCRGRDGYYRVVYSLYLKNGIVPVTAVCNCSLYYPYTPNGTSNTNRVIGGVLVDDDTGIDENSDPPSGGGSHVIIDNNPGPNIGGGGGPDTTPNTVEEKLNRLRQENEAANAAYLSDQDLQ